MDTGFQNIKLHFAILNVFQIKITNYLTTNDISICTAKTSTTNDINNHYNCVL